MPSLPPALRRPQPWLAAAGLLFFLGLLDLFRSPGHQATGGLYIAGVHLYQWSKPRLGLKSRCRFVPSCSRYSVQAVEHYGLIRGWQLTWSRLDRCRMNVPKGTPDPLGESPSKAAPHH
jgi:putative component of membrane protein insertase Oxa1/YidC/SpoIIIJ protein YidD